MNGKIDLGGCAFHPADPGSSPMHTIYPFSLLSSKLCHIFRCNCEKNENKQKEAGLGQFLRIKCFLLNLMCSTSKICLFVGIEPWTRKSQGFCVLLSHHSPPWWLYLLASPMVMDPLSQQPTGLQHAVFQPQQEVTRDQSYKDFTLRNFYKHSDWILNIFNQSKCLKK